eukprot:TRINITY_DN9308_c0_g1_i1.p1 TRINITY_DN9308_c0_g1~~TRINITY_DN9308_c0_g1_i1.p1  ORF type:complete len:460 (+),score=46.65 TRINITY_DN9308_c0_g1_i1:62-1441(+)
MAHEQQLALLNSLLTPKPFIHGVNTSHHSVIHGRRGEAHFGRSHCQLSRHRHRAAECGQRFVFQLRPACYSGTSHQHPSLLQSRFPPLPCAHWSGTSDHRARPRSPVCALQNESGDFSGTASALLGLLWKPFADKGTPSSKTELNVVLEAPAEPVTEGQLVAVSAVEQGLRDEMEDEVVIVQDVPGGFVYVGVFDGHVGTATARYLKRELYDQCLRALDGGALLARELDEEGVQVIQERLSEAFAESDSKLLSWQQEEATDEERESGSTASVLFIRKDRIILASVGDSRVVLCAGEETRDLTEDHRLSGDSDMAQAEVKRVQSSGGWVSKGRLCGSIAISRAFGDVMYKRERDAMLTEGLKKGRWTKRFVQKLKTEEEWLLVEPTVQCLDLPSDSEFVLVASDGLWDAVRSGEAVRHVKEQLAEHGDVQKACDSLVQFALKERKGDDNVSLILVQLPSQ